MFAKFASVVVVAMTVLGANAESHTINFTNNCGRGTPQLVQNGNILSSGQPFTSNGPFTAGIAYLQTGGCGLNGDNCMTVEMTLQNPTSPGSGSSTDLSLIPPLAFNVPIRFEYANGCDGQGQTCGDANCNTAFHVPTDNQVQVACQSNDVNLNVIFCP
ncbi:glycopeptide [Dendrothele bispora CBS 962.96]|uniref:Glycopeptide n=1 Tax=Dendrothele bispora (strain CBS 962.96) TaxID=1314807 RepID=A0A4S8LSB6_DENBC|nr:glycopeptide [Dendrothele bispora CBS 962.96]